MFVFFVSVVGEDVGSGGGEAYGKRLEEIGRVVISCVELEMVCKLFRNKWELIFIFFRKYWSMRE